MHPKAPFQVAGSESREKAVEQVPADGKRTADLPGEKDDAILAALDASLETA